MDGDTNRFTVRSRAADGTAWTMHARGRIVDGDAVPVTVPVATGSTPGGTEVMVIPGEELYRLLDQAGLTYGPAVPPDRRGAGQPGPGGRADRCRARRRPSPPGPSRRPGCSVAVCRLVGGRRRRPAGDGSRGGGPGAPVPRRPAARRGQVTWLVPLPGEADLVADIVLAEPAVRS
ncbi:MAG: polyketide synthase dehydratase domain-containing protein [Kineosporiaceae bacterium]|nr:polyketide synthase dehydratase domain-containing protein [Kineosporiaceae bacterium]